jgi:hypothetical protein
MPDLLQSILEQSSALLDALNTHLDQATLDGSSRSQLTHAAAEIALEHGQSICFLVAGNALTSAIVLLRTQFEAVTRTLWLHYAATDDWVAKYLASVPPGSQKDPNQTPAMDEMLKSIGATAPAAVGRMLTGLKQGAWASLNSYVHTGLQPMLKYHLGHAPEYAIQTVRNANGLSVMAAMVIAMLTGNRDVTRIVRDIQLRHLDCLPPLAAPAEESP